MKQTNIKGVFRDKKQIFTENLPSAKGIKVYNERIVKNKDKEFRAWNPYRSKFAAAILNKLDIKINPDFNVLYLGSATGTTVSHVSDIVKTGNVYAVENSPIAMKKFLKVCETRKNIFPIFQDANHPEKYYSVVPNVDFIYQDISQRNQADIFIRNSNKFLKEKSKGIIMVKARSIDVSLKPKKAYDLVCNTLKQSDFIIDNIIDLYPFEKDHAAIVVTR